MKNKQKRFTIVSDNDGHDYYIPVESKDEFYEWLEDEERSTYAESDKYAYCRIDGTFTFTDPKCE